jgi:hypothetical protein
MIWGVKISMVSPPTDCHCHWCLQFRIDFSPWFLCEKRGDPRNRWRMIQNVTQRLEKSVRKDRSKSYFGWASEILHQAG